MICSQDEALSNSLSYYFVLTNWTWGGGEYAYFNFIILFKGLLSVLIASTRKEKQINEHNRQVETDFPPRGGSKKEA